LTILVSTGRRRMRRCRYTEMIVLIAYVMVVVVEANFDASVGLGVGAKF